jgi:hypothetical protein
MIGQHPTIGGTLVRELRATIAALAAAASGGPLGAVTVLGFAARLDGHACALAVAEEALDRLADEAREMDAEQRAIAAEAREAHLAHREALRQAHATGRVVLFPLHRRYANVPVSGGAA